ncbi:unannotated protein [freshwater metagenome]|uniref:Unannotated protein n=1 Tax=freshwater metagenome TaxID=449393 RepID=A0A6J6WAF3_9ZZZZ|nr:hypothetical protein [Actinomycetota bacterium]
MNFWGWAALFLAILVVGTVVNLLLIRRVWRSGKRLRSEISTIRRQVKRQ